MPTASEQNLVSVSLLARIETLEAENTRLKKGLPSREIKFTVEQIMNDDKLFCFLHWI